MTRHTVNNLIVDAVAFAAFALLTATGLVQRYLLPPGTGHFRSLWGLNRHQWGEIHFWIAVVLMAALAVHILLHWKWIAAVVRGRQSEASGWRVAFGAVGLIGLLGFSIAPFLTAVEKTDGSGHRRQQEHGGNAAHTRPRGDLRGSMTLADVEQETGVSAAVILGELGLPEDVPRDEKLGRLRREYGFEMHDVRQIVESNAPRAETESP